MAFEGLVADVLMVVGMFMAVLVVMRMPVSIVMIMRMIVRTSVRMVARSYVQVTLPVVVMLPVMLLRPMSVCSRGVVQMIVIVILGTMPVRVRMDMRLHARPPEGSSAAHLFRCP